MDFCRRRHTKLKKNMDFCRRRHIKLKKIWKNKKAEELPLENTPKWTKKRIFEKK